VPAIWLIKDDVQFFVIRFGYLRFFGEPVAQFFVNGFVLGLNVIMAR